MKKMKGLLVAMKDLLLAIILGGILGNLVCIVEILPTFANDYVPRLLIITVVSWLSFYFLFMRSGKTKYALTFILSEYIVGWISVGFWWKIFKLSADTEGIGIAKAGIAYLLIPSIFLCTFMNLAIEFIKFRKWLKEGAGKIAETELLQTEKNSNYDKELEEALKEK